MGKRDEIMEHLVATIREAFGSRKTYKKMDEEEGWSVTTQARGVKVTCTDSSVLTAVIIDLNTAYDCSSRGKHEVIFMRRLVF